MAKKQSAKKKKHKPTKASRTSNPTTPKKVKPIPNKVKPIPINTIPPEAFLEFLYRCPVKFLIRSMCVSKLWVALIANPTFIQKHLNINSSGNKQLICSSCHDNGRRKLIAFLSAKEPPIRVLDIDINFSDRPNYPRRINFGDFSKKMVLAGSINGIVCLTHSEEMLGHFVALWNPAIRRWKPIALPETRSWKGVSVGLGFDVVMNDLKIICIVPVNTTKIYVGWSRVEIYSANRDSWDDVDEQGIIPFFPVLNLLHCKFIVKGVPYWVGIDAEEASDYKVLGGIDPCTRLFKKVLFPEHIKNESTLVHVVNLRDSVVALIQSPGENPNKMVDLYVLDENNANWTRMYSIGPLEFETLWPPQCLSTGEIVLVMWTGDIDHASNVVHYFCDPTTNHVFSNNKMEVLDPHWRESYSHVESLVCLKGMVEIGKEHISKKTDPRMNDWSEYLSEEFEAALHLE